MRKRHFLDAWFLRVAAAALPLLDSSSGGCWQSFGAVKGSVAQAVSVVVGQNLMVGAASVTRRQRRRGHRNLMSLVVSSGKNVTRSSRPGLGSAAMFGAALPISSFFAGAHSQQRYCSSQLITTTHCA
jgi:hypothetical protein